MLENPIWHSLASRHSHLAISHGLARRYPPEVAPFGAVQEPTAQAARDLEAIVTPGEKVALLSVIPELPWKLERCIEIHQYIWPEEGTFELDPDALLLTEDHIPAMLELTALVYPAYFRPGTARLGDYFGLFDGRRLAAMAGIRMAMDGYQELSAICTHPDYRGRGFAGQLTKHLIGHVARKGDIPFLHTESDNPAKGLYEKLGFGLSRRLSFQVLSRP
jgi:GNAT superfamily N-acetyltransferase